VWRQTGGSLIPLSFIICIEYFSRLLTLASRKATFNFHPKCAFHGIYHLAFADDVLLLSRGYRQSVQTLFQHLQIFCKTSGLVISAAKSSVYFGGVGADLKQVILHDTGFSEGIFPFKYLGVPLSPHTLLASQLSPLLHKLEVAVQRWAGKHLSYTSRLELLRSVLFSIVQF